MRFPQSGGGQVLSRKSLNYLLILFCLPGPSSVPLTREVAEGPPEFLTLGNTAQSPVTGGQEGRHPLHLGFPETDVLWAGGQLSTYDLQGGL